MRAWGRTSVSVEGKTVAAHLVRLVFAAISVPVYAFMHGVVYTRNLVYWGHVNQMERRTCHMHRIQVYAFNQARTVDRRVAMALSSYQDDYIKLWDSHTCIHSEMSKYSSYIRKYDYADAGLYVRSQV